MSKAILQLLNVERTYRQGARELPVLRGASLEIKPGELVALVAPSGAGKSTLLHVAGLLEQPNAGEVVIRNIPTRTLSDQKRTQLRSRAVGFVYSWSRFSAIFTSFIIAGVLKEFGSTGVFVFIAGAMMIVMAAIGLMGPKTRDVALEKISH